MKLKGISPLEQNVDRIVLGVAGLALAGAVAYQVLPEGNMVEVDKVKVRAADAHVPVEKFATGLEAQLNGSIKEPTDLPVFTLGDRLKLGNETPQHKGARVAMGALPAVGGTTITHGDSANDAFAEIHVPAPTSGIASEVQVTISPVEKVRNAALAKLLPEAQPFDKTSVSIEFSFSGAALRMALQADPDGDGPIHPIPVTWWRDQGNGQNVDLIDIVGVQVERETVSKADGTTPATPEAVILQAPPGRAFKLDEWKKIVRSPGDVPPMLENVRLVSEEVQRPAFYDTIAGPAWEPPSKMSRSGNAAEKAVKINELNREIAEIDARLVGLNERLQAAPATEDKKDAKAPPTPPPGGSRRGPAPSGPGQQESKSTKDAGGNRQVIQQQINNQTTQRARKVKQLEDLGQKPVDPNAGAAAVALPFLDNPDVKVWTHDMTAEAGATYRYRARVVVNNPIFGRNLQPSQASLAANSLIEGDWSDWTSEISIDRPSYFFVTSASEANMPMSPQPSAVAEMYVFKYGYYRRARVSLTPGDVLAGEATMPKDLRYADMAKLETMLQVAPGAGGQAPGTTPPPPPPGNVLPPGEHGRGPGRMAPPGGAPGQVQPPPASGNPAAMGLAPEWLTVPVPAKEQMKVDVVFLDAAEQPNTTLGGLGGVQSVVQAMLRDEFGRILVRLPSKESGGDVYKRVAESAKAGETQGAIVVKPPVEAAPRVPGPDQRERVRTPTPPPGGGGGGGGGGG